MSHLTEEDLRVIRKRQNHILPRLEENRRRVRARRELEDRKLAKELGMSLEELRANG